MAFIPTPNTARAVVLFSFGALNFSNVFHFTKADYTELEMSQLAVAVDNAAGDVFRTHLVASISYISTTCYDIRSLNGPVVVNSASAGVGGQTGSAAPINEAIVVTLRTNSRGRSGRGRVYLAGFNDDALTNNAWSEATRTAAQDFITALRTNAQAVGWTHVIRSIQQDGVHLTTGVTRIVTAFDVRSLVVGTQRRRLDRG